VPANSAVTVNLNGQRHEAERRAWLKERAGLPYLATNLIVQIDIDELSRRLLFSATRERMVEGSMQTLIYDEAVAALHLWTDEPAGGSCQISHILPDFLQSLGDLRVRKTSHQVRYIAANDQPWGENRDRGQRCLRYAGNGQCELRARAWT
jgi:hypothetical protein